MNGLGCSYFCLLIQVRSVSDFIIKEIVVMNFNYFLLFVFLNVESSAQLILSTSPSFTGIPSSVFEQLTPGGPVTRVNSGFAEMNFASISRDGGSILFSASDPVDPVLQIPPSSDLYRFDRATGQTLRLVDQESIIVPNPVARQSAVFTPEFNALSPDGSEVAFTNRVTLLDGNTNPERGRNLSIVRADGSQEGGVIEMGRGKILDDFDSEFVGMSWTPDGQSFATSGYIPTFDPLRGAFTEAVGIVCFSRSGNTFVRSGTLSVPRITRTGIISTEFGLQILPTFSPSGNALAYFDLVFPSALLNAPVTARLIIANADGSGAVVRVPFAPGNYPLGLTWSEDGSQLVFSLAPQLQTGSIFSPLGDATQATIFTTAAFGGDTSVNQIAGISSGFSPSVATSSTVTNPPSVDLSSVPINLTRAPNGGFTLQVDNLDPAANYVIESSTTLPNFGNPQTFSGQDFMNGIGISIVQSGSLFFRIRNP